MILITGPFGNGIVRLFRDGVTSSSYYYGIVQIRYNGRWGNICDDSYYDQFEADVISAASKRHVYFLFLFQNTYLISNRDLGTVPEPYGVGYTVGASHR